MVGSEINMNKDEAKHYAEDCKKSGNLDYPLAGSISTPKCKICKNADFRYGTLESPICLAINDVIPLDMRACRSYDCLHFVHDKKSEFNREFDKNLNPLRK